MILASFANLMLFDVIELIGRAFLMIEIHPTRCRNINWWDVGRIELMNCLVLTSKIRMTLRPEHQPPEDRHELACRPDLTDPG